MTSKVKQLIDEFFPGFANGQIVVGLANVGVCAVNMTLSVNSAQTNAQIIAAPPNTAAAGAPTGVCVHSFGTAPTLTIVQERGAYPGTATMYGLIYSIVTADNSAIYMRAVTHTNALAANNGVGMAVTVTAIR